MRGSASDHDTQLENRNEALSEAIESLSVQFLGKAAGKSSEPMMVVLNKVGVVGHLLRLTEFRRSEHVSYLFTCF